MEFQRARESRRSRVHYHGKQTGPILSDIWDSMKGKHKSPIVKQIVDVEKAITAGALYYKRLATFSQQ